MRGESGDEDWEGVMMSGVSVIVFIYIFFPHFFFALLTSQQHKSQVKSLEPILSRVKLGASAWCVRTPTQYPAHTRPVE